MGGPEVRIRPAGADDAAEIRAVLRGSFGGNPKTDEAVMAWQYWDNPFGPARSWVAEAEGRVVAHYAGIALPGIIGGAPATLALGIDAATDPAFRGLGLFEALARAVYADAGAAGMPVTYCLPNPNSLRGFNKAGGQDLGRARALVAPLDAAWLAARLHLPTPLGRVARAPFRLGRGGGAGLVEGPPAGLDDLWAGLAPADGNGVKRDSPWWDWRYVHRPGDAGYIFAEARRAGRLVGAAVARVRSDLGGPMLCLLELAAADDRAARDLVGHLASTAAGGAVGIATTALAGTPIYRSARAGGLWPHPRRLEPAPMHVGVVDNLARLPGLARQPWSLAWGDLDHI
ncbi:MAG: GNAT family N-acetyltransferase [Acidimicrobiales bacterium]